MGHLALLLTLRVAGPAWCRNRLRPAGSLLRLAGHRGHRHPDRGALLRASTEEDLLQDLERGADCPGEFRLPRGSGRNEPKAEAARVRVSFSPNATVPSTRGLCGPPAGVADGSRQFSRRCRCCLGIGEVSRRSTIVCRQIVEFFPQSG